MCTIPQSTIKVISHASCSATTSRDTTRLPSSGLMISAVLVVRYGCNQHGCHAGAWQTGS